MSTKVIPWWLAWLGVEAGDALRRAVRELLSDLPFSRQYLAEQIKVDPSTVSRWAAGKTVPSPSELRAIQQEMELRLARLETQVQWGKQLLEALDVSLRSGGAKAHQARKKVQALLTKADARRSSSRGKRKRK